MRNLAYAFLLSAVVVLTGCPETTVGPTPITQLPRPLTSAETQLVHSNSAFAFKLFQAIAARDTSKNVFFSPLSVGMALGMTYNGAAGATRDSMAKTLELGGLTLQQVNESYQSVINLLQNLDPQVQYALANSIWYRQGFAVSQA